MNSGPHTRRQASHQLSCPCSLAFRFFNWETQPGLKPTVVTGGESLEASRFTSLSGFPFPWVSPTTGSGGAACFGVGLASQETADLTGQADSSF